MRLSLADVDALTPQHLVPSAYSESENRYVQSFFAVVAQLDPRDATL